MSFDFFGCLFELISLWKFNAETIHWLLRAYGALSVKNELSGSGSLHRCDCRVGPSTIAFFCDALLGKVYAFICRLQANVARGLSVGGIDYYYVVCIWW